MVSSMVRFGFKSGSCSKNEILMPFRVVTWPVSEVSLPAIMLRMDVLPLPFLAIRAIFWSLLIPKVISEKSTSSPYDFDMFSTVNKFMGVVCAPAYSLEYLIIYTYRMVKVKSNGISTGEKIWTLIIQSNNTMPINTKAYHKYFETHCGTLSCTTRAKATMIFMGNAHKIL